MKIPEVQDLGSFQVGECARRVGHLNSTRTEAAVFKTLPDLICASPPLTVHLYPF